MSFGGFAWDMSQQREIDALTARVDASEQTSRYVGGGGGAGEMERLQARVDALVLTNMAMWTLIRDRLKLTDADLETMVHNLDLADGSKDGKIRVAPWACGKCQRPNPARSVKCMYCGHQKATSQPFPLS